MANTISIVPFRPYIQHQPVSSSRAPFFPELSRKVATSSFAAPISFYFSKPRLQLSSLFFARRLSGGTLAVSHLLARISLYCYKPEPHLYTPHSWLFSPLDLPSSLVRTTFLAILQPFYCFRQADERWNSVCKPVYCWLSDNERFEVSVSVTRT